MSAFDEWFVAQHGPPPSTRTLMEIEDKMVDLEGLAGYERRLFREMQEYERRRTSALWAWQARSGQPCDPVEEPVTDEKLVTVVECWKRNSKGWVMVDRYRTDTRQPLPLVLPDPPFILWEPCDPVEGVNPHEEP